MKVSPPSGPVIRVTSPLKKDILTIRILIVMALACVTCFVIWFADANHIGYGPIFWILTCALLFKLVKMVHEWYHYWSPSIPQMPESKRNWKVDILTTACPGEPKDMIIRTLQAMVAVKYPHTNYLCDEGDDPGLKEICRQLGVIHVTRKEKKDAKAGNINNALKQATGEICVVLDPDHVPVREFLDRALPYFEDPSIGFVQCVQAYGNQEESFIALGAAEQTYHFYGPMMMCMNTYGTVQAIGANCTFRRSALDSIGGHAAGLSEDMHTAMQLHAKGWKSVYIPEILSRGLVPATLSSYYKQQLKWSRGTFELLFRTYPVLFKNFTWRQKIHYFTIPLYFLFGLINLIDIAIPVAALSLAEVPWAVDLGRFAFIFVPMCCLSLLIRLFAQRWLLEKHEHGLHLAGGILRTATWWIFLIGFVYTIFKIKVPYIPTPKEDRHENYWRLSVPNMLVVMVSFIAVIFGLSIDWTPYSFAMAGYALINAGMLAFAVLMSQQKLLADVKSSLSTVPLLNNTANGFVIAAQGSRSFAYKLIRNGPAAIIIALSVLFFSYSSIEDENGNKDHAGQKDLGGFYFGVQHNSQKLTPAILKEKVSLLPLHKDILSDTWLKEEDLDKKSRQEEIPLLFLDLPKEDHPGLYNDIAAGKHDKMLKTSASFFRKYAEPVFICFAPDFDRNKTIGTPQEFVKAWQYTYTFFNELGISNLTWIWNPSTANAEDFYPGTKFVDWVGVKCLNYSEAKKDQDWYSFDAIYSPFRKAYGKFEKPVMVTSFGCSAGPDQADWISSAFSDIGSKFREVRSVVFYSEASNGSSLDVFNICSDRTVKTLSDVLTENNYSQKPVFKQNVTTAALPVYRSLFIKGTPGKFDLIVSGKPFYIRGVAYNTAHDWRDGNMPLTRRQVIADMDRMKEMGANAIRRYDHGIYDRNVLNIASEKDLKVQFGFWFDPKVDYYRDTNRVREYMEQVEESVLQFRDHEALLAWSLGNETWGLLKHHYAKPYLTKVRNAYVAMIEALAEKIHAIDPAHPVFASMEHEEYQLPGEIVAFRDKAPSLDAIGVNSYYRQQISKLNHITWHFDSLRPYLISEFGPRGYWDPTYNRSANGSLIEDSDNEKAQWYAIQWRDYVTAYRGNNIGGFAYCWHDRMEGSNTWFGLTDFKGRCKPAYFALQKEWTGKSSALLPEFNIVTATTTNTKNMVFNATTTRLDPRSDYHYEWEFYKNEFLEKIEDFEISDDGRTVIIDKPEEKGRYRLYLYVTDPSGKVTTASLPVVL
jgi:cellulose synthase (UDP-forming)